MTAEELLREARTMIRDRQGVCQNCQEDWPCTTHKLIHPA